MRIAIVLGICLPLIVTGCSLTPTADTSVAIHGKAHGGMQPIIGGHVYF